MSTHVPQPKPTLEEIAPYVAGKSKISGHDGPLLKLSSNESPYGPSPKAVEAYKNAGEHLELYPDGSAQVLREAIGKTHALNPDQILCGAGSDEILNMIAQAYIDKNDEGIYTEHGFLVYKLAILGAGGKIVVVLEHNLKADTTALLKAITPQTKVIFIANPNNPTGTYLTTEELMAFHTQIPPHVLLVVDEAYAECVTASDYSTALSLAKTAQNVIVTRTLSKLYALPALRIGWCFAQTNIITNLNKVRGPFNMTHPSLMAGKAAIEDQSYIEQVKAKNAIERNRLTKELESLGLKVTPSEGNFVLVHFDSEGENTALKADTYLQKAAIIVRRVDNYGFPDALRITVGTTEQNTKVIQALKCFLNI